jgi:hypothetical protein
MLVRTSILIRVDGVTLINLRCQHKNKHLLEWSKLSEETLSFLHRQAYPIRHGLVAAFAEGRLVMPDSAELMTYVGYRLIIRTKRPASLSHDAQIPPVKHLYECKVHFSFVTFLMPLGNISVLKSCVQQTPTAGKHTRHVTLVRRIAYHY